MTSCVTLSRIRSGYYVPQIQDVDTFVITLVTNFVLISFGVASTALFGAIRPISVGDAGILLLGGFSGFAGHVLMIVAYKVSEVKLLKVERKQTSLPDRQRDLDGPSPQVVGHPAWSGRPGGLLPHLPGRSQHRRGGHHSRVHLAVGVQERRGEENLHPLLAEVVALPGRVRATGQ